METILEIFENCNIFALIQASIGLTWFSSDDATSLDLDYFFQHSGQKYISNLVRNLKTKYSDSYIAKLVSIINLKYKEKWNRIYLALIDADYNPIENYDSTETYTPNEFTRTKTISQNTDVTRDIDSKVFGFNSSEEVSLNSGTEHSTGLADNNITSDVEVESGEHTTTRHGNIGVTTNQQMITQEIEMRDKFNLYDIMMKDVDKILALPIY